MTFNNTDKKKKKDKAYTSTTMVINTYTNQ